MNLPFLDDATVAGLLDSASVRDALDEAFQDLAAGNAAIQRRFRTDCGGVKLSAMGGIWAARGVAGTKAYTTVGGQFSFLLTLFDTLRNCPVALLEANELTRFRTAALSRLVASKAAPRAPRKLALFGQGLQGRAQAQALCEEFRLEEVAVVDPQGDDAWCARMALRYGCRVTLTHAAAAVAHADLVVTATRSKSPVFDGSGLKPGALVIALGTSLPDGREMDDTTLRRASHVLVEWLPQSLEEAGDVVQGLATGSLDRARLADLPALYRGEARWREDDQDIVVFKTVGVGLSDVAAAWLAVQRL